jgi:hypothetical protein
MRGRRIACCSLVAALFAAAPVPAGGVEVRDADRPMVGDCLSLTDEDLEQIEVARVSTVPCTDSHLLEVTLVESFDQERASMSELRAMGEERCGSLGVWNELGVNRSLAGVISAPMRIEARYIVIRDPSPSLVCGAAVVEWTQGFDNEPVQTQVVARRGSLEGMSSRERAGLRYCFDGESRRRPQLPDVTHSCRERPRWHADAWIVWQAFFDEDPGPRALRAQAKRLCGEGARFSLPPSSAWAEGTPRTWCFVRQRGDVQ